MASQQVDTLKRAKTRFVETRRALATRIATKSAPASVEDANSLAAIQDVMEVIDAAIADEQNLPDTLATTSIASRKASAKPAKKGAIK